MSSRSATVDEVSTAADAESVWQIKTHLRGIEGAMEKFTVAQFVFVFAISLAAMVTDLKWRRIPNWLTVSAMVLGFTFHAFTAGTAGLLFAAGGFCVGFGFLFVLWCIGGGGGGDVKLMGALGAWMGAMPTLFVFVLSAFMGFVCLLAVMIWNGTAAQTLTAGATGSGGSGGSSRGSSILKKTIPYAVPAGLSAWLVLLVKMFVDSSQV